MILNKPILNWHSIPVFESELDSYDLWIPELNYGFSVYYSLLEPQGWCFTHQSLKSQTYENANDAMCGCEKHILHITERIGATHQKLKNHYAWYDLSEDNPTYPSDGQVCWLILKSGIKNLMTWRYDTYTKSFYDSSRQSRYQIDEVLQWSDASVPV